MAKKKWIEDIDDDILEEHNAVASAQKFPSSTTGDITVIDNFGEIRCERITEYQSKQGRDFSKWNKANFELLKESIREYGVMQPVIVRVINNEQTPFEMLAGEHRWKACLALGLETIPAKILRNCSDTLAQCIFTSTNVLSRSFTLRDKINGWYHFSESTKYFRDEDFERLIKNNLIDASVVNEFRSKRRNILRYIHLHDLSDFWIDLMEKGKLSLVKGDHLSYLTIEQQRDLEEYQEQIIDLKAAGILMRKLANGEIENRSWCREDIKFLLTSSPENQITPKQRMANEVIKLLEANGINENEYGAILEKIANLIQSHQ